MSLFFNKMSKDNYISLKEAAALSGYTPDYIGQLIRKGKIEGKQIFSNVAWVTTPEALAAYQKKDRAREERKVSREEWWLERGMPLALRVSGFAALAIAATLLVLAFYILSAGIEHRMAERALAGVASTQHATP